MKVIFYDLDGGHEAASIAMPGQYDDNFFAGFDQSGCLLTNTFEGCFRWRVRPDLAEPDMVVIGPPERLRLYPRNNMTASSRDGKVIAQAMMGGYSAEIQSGGWLLHRGKRENPRNLHPGFHWDRPALARTASGSCSGSPGPFFVHDAETGKQVWAAPGEHGRSLFLPDGKWLGTDVDNGRLYAVRTWKPGPQLGPGYLACFSHDSTLADP